MPAMPALGVLCRSRLIRYVLRLVAEQDFSEDEGCENSGIKQRPDANGEELLVHHAARQAHLGDEVRELRTANHSPADDPAVLAHEGRAEDLCRDARTDAHDGTLPECVKGEELTHRNGERDRAREEDAQHPLRDAFRLFRPYVVSVEDVMAQARKGHARDEAPP